MQTGFKNHPPDSAHFVSFGLESLGCLGSHILKIMVPLALQWMHEAGISLNAHKKMKAIRLRTYLLQHLPHLQHTNSLTGNEEDSEYQFHS